MKNYNDYRSPVHDKLYWSACKIFNRQLNVEGKDVLVDGVPVRALIQTHTNPYNELKEDRKFLCNLDVNINRGSIVNYNNKNWLVFSEVKDNKVYKYTKILQCFHSININKNGVLLEVPCVIDSNVRLYSMGQDENKYISTVDDEIIVYVSNNPDTQTIKEDQVYKIGRRNYEVISIQDVIHPGLLVIKMQVTDQQSTFKEHEYSISILNGEEVVLNALEHSTLQLEVQCKLDGAMVKDPEVIFESSDENCAIVDKNGLVTIQGTGTSVITATYGNAITTIKIIGVVNVTDNFDITIIPVDTKMYVNTTKTFTAKVTNNGIDMPYYSVLWSLENVDGSNKEYCTYEINERDIIITAKNLINKQIRIKAVLLNDNSVFEEKIITFESLV